MQTLPLITHTSFAKPIAWRKGISVSVEEFLADVNYLATLLPAGKHILNVCKDRYHFSVGLAAAIISNKVSVLPPTHTPEMLRQLQIFSPDVFCLYDNDDCDIALPRFNYPTMPKHPAKKVSIPRINTQQLIAIVFTSGSTGQPNPHPKKWGSLVQNVQAQAKRLGLSESNEYSFIGTIPPQHMYGFESTVLLPWQSGNAISSAQPFYPADICSAMQSIPAPRILVSTPLHLRLLLDSELNIAEPALLLSATAPLSYTLADKVETTLKAPLIEIYGSTETGQIATRRTIDGDSWQLLPQIKLTQQGEQVFAEGGHVEVATTLNDIIELTEPGFFLLHGRTQDLINIAGKRSSLTNLNHHLNAIEGVIDGAFFMPDELSHDHVTRLSACVVAPNLTASQLLAALRTKIDPAFLPRPLLFLETLPRNATGKLPREALKKLFDTSINKDLSCTQN
ncbi:MAG: AMP-binding protein [Methylotenera sp.]|uniref:AMP-binding protein n=1 Tax=Methylotenera sp. TaxID=2051956 RepID=UPI002488DA19|nr:AMP-binding protein [Methylotenera sp.]MDI1308696.1 AMP-binding protein [Methylotenera sp.]